MNVERRQAAADPRPRLRVRLYRLPESTPTIAHRHLLLLLSPKANTHFTIPPM